MAITRPERLHQFRKSEAVYFKVRVRPATCETVPKRSAGTIYSDLAGRVRMDVDGVPRSCAVGKLGRDERVGFNWAGVRRPDDLVTV